MNISLNHDGNISIAIGRSRKELHWKNKEMLWSALVKRLGENHRTAETFDNYMAAKKTRRDEIKDIGGFVGGVLAGGRRKSGSVTSRSLITLDADYATTDFWDNYTLLFNHAAACYSTHSHSAEKPRYRLILPLSRELLPDEYEPVARKLAESLGISHFDDTTYQVERLMYFPSSAKDGDAFFEYTDGPWLNPDKVLAQYHNWKDSSQWPVSERQHEIIRRELKKQEDPLEKPGIVGAFCRAYNIDEAIAQFLPELYESCDVPNRYTYTQGSAAAGLVVYDDKFAYSHHGTDPSSGKLCNAFDLVRLHLYGDRDEDSAGKGFAQPSYQAMLDMASADKEVKKLLAAEKWQQAKADFEGIGDGEDLDMDWMAGLETDRKGNFLSNVFNLLFIIENDPRLKGRIAFNEFSRKPNVLKPLPWDKVDFSRPREWEDADQAIIENYLSLKPYELNISSLKVRNVLEEVKHDNAYHPVKQYLSRQKWDGRPRVDTLFIDYLGCEDSEYTKAITRKTLTAAVARIFTPGCKFDYVLTLLGAEGIGKSTIFKKLGKSWFTDTFNFKMITMGTKQAYEQLQGCWIIEIPEMTGLRKADENAVKGFLTSVSDNYRASHKQETLDRKRQNIFVGSSNNMDFLKAGTGNRRFWPLPTMIAEPAKNIKELTESEIDQIWAEAVQCFKAGEELYLSAELEKEARKKQREHTEEDAWVGTITEYLDKLLPENWKDMGDWDRKTYIHNSDPLAAKGVIQRDRVCVKEIWTEALEGKFNQISNEQRRNISRIMDNMEGWEKADKAIWMITGETQKGWYRKDLGLFSDANIIGKKDADLPF